jgi:hypothetical protein
MKRNNIASLGHEIRRQRRNNVLPLRFLICMISAMTNPFLYSYFNETFKNGLQKIFSSCCSQMNREINQTDYLITNVKF